MKVLIKDNQMVALNNQAFKVPQGGAEIENIFVETPPDTTEYVEGGNLNLTGIVVKATFSNGMVLNVTDQCTFSPAEDAVLSTTDTKVIISAFDKTTSQDITVSEIHIYGAEWFGGPETTWIRRDSAELFANPNPYYVGNDSPSSPFDTIQPWAGMIKEEIPGAGTCVKIPKYWYKWTRRGDAMKLQIADGPANGFLVSPAHADRGDGFGERDYVYVGRYHCADDYTSKTGVLPKINMTRSDFRINIHSLGSNIWQHDYAMRWTINMLYLVEFADWDSQKVIGHGCGNNSEVENCGASDAMPYHTGTMQTSRDAYGVGVQYRNIEGLWDNAFDWYDGVYFNGTNVYCIKNPSQFNDTIGGTLTSARVTSGGYITALNSPTASGFEYALYPSAVDWRESVYIPDYCYYNASGVVLYGGGSYTQVLGSGAFCLYGNSVASSMYRDVGSRLMILP